LTGAYLPDANLPDANLTDANLYLATMPDGTTWTLDTDTSQWTSSKGARNEN